MSFWCSNSMGSSSFFKKYYYHSLWQTWNRLGNMYAFVFLYNSKFFSMLLVVTPGSRFFTPLRGESLTFLWEFFFACVCVCSFARKTCLFQNPKPTHHYHHRQDFLERKRMIIIIAIIVSSCFQFPSYFLCLCTHPPFSIIISTTCSAHLIVSVILLIPFSWQQL